VPLSVAGRAPTGRQGRAVGEGTTDRRAEDAMEADGECVQSVKKNRALARSVNPAVPTEKTPHGLTGARAPQFEEVLTRTPIGTRTVDRHFRQFDVSLIHKSSSE
jgi:hypothetical protein